MLKGECKAHIEVNPQQAYFARVLDQKPQERRLKIVNKTDAPLKLKMREIPNSKFKYELTEIVEGQEFELVVRLEPPFKEGHLHERLYLDTNSEKKKVIEIWARATVPPRIEVDPRSVRYVVPKKEGRPFTTAFKVNNHGDRPLKVHEVVSSIPEIKTTLVERTPGKIFMIRVEIPAGFEVPKTGARITVKTDDPEKGDIQVPVTVYSPPEQRDIGDRRNVRLKAGSPIPPFNLKTAQGKAVTNGTAMRETTILNFVAPDATLCRSQITKLESIRKKLEEFKVHVIYVREKFRKAMTDDAATAELQKQGLNVETAQVFHDVGNKLGKTFGVATYPTLIILGRDGKVKDVLYGIPKDFEDRVEVKVLPKSKKAVESRDKKADHPHTKKPGN